jgi:hypothetical protein
LLSIIKVFRIWFLLSTTEITENTELFKTQNIKNNKLFLIIQKSRN